MPFLNFLATQIHAPFPVMLLHSCLGSAVTSSQVHASLRPFWKAAANSRRRGSSAPKATPCMTLRFGRELVMRVDYTYLMVLMLWIVDGAIGVSAGLVILDLRKHQSYIAC